jgi:outer membrane protein assembly factor BamB
MQPLAPTDPRAAGEFRLSARLGHGGMGQVFLGYSPAGRAVAVKMCHPELAADPTFVERFAREATAAQAVNGLYTAQVVAAGPYDKPPWMATAYVPGPSLTDYVYAHGPLPEVAAWRLAAGLAEALLAVHACGLVHRDLKPSNVLLATDGPRVIDFGIASALEDTGLTTTGSVMGSPPYMAPEQAMGTPAGPAGDIFALGSTLAFAAAGAAPFGDGDAHAVLFRVVHMPPAIDAVPERLRPVVAACLAKDPAARPTLPQLLHACRDAVAAGGNSAASFWPSQMTAVIAGYQAGPGSPPPPNATMPSHGPGLTGGPGLSDGYGLSGGQRGAHPPTMAATSGAPTWQVSTSRTGSTLAGAIGRRRLLTGLGGVVVAGGLAAGGWKLASSGSGSTGSTSTGAVGTAAGRSTDRRVAWTYQAAGPIRSDGAISADGGTFYIGSADGTAYSLDAATGRHVNKFQVGSAVSGVTVAGGTLLAGAADGKVYAFIVGSQGFKWTSPAAGAAIADAPTTGGNVVYAGSDDHYVYALDLRTGARKWRTKTGGTPLPSQPTGTGVVWVGSQDGTMYVLSTATGKVVGKLAVGGPVGSTPLTVTGQVYVGTGNGVLYDLFYEDFTNTTELEWSFPAGGAITGTPVPAARGDTIFTATTRGTVYAVQPGSNIGNEPGTALWSRPVGGPVRSGLAVYNGAVYAGSDDGYLYAIDISTSDVRWKYKTGGAIRSKIVASNGLVYFGSLDHHVYALRA